MTNICVSNEWFAIGTVPPIPDCTGDCPECEDCEDQYVIPEANERFLENEFGRIIDSVIFTIDHVAENESCKDFYIDAKMSGNITMTNDLINYEPETDCTITFSGNSGSKIDSIRSDLKIIFNDKKGNVILDGFFKSIKGEIKNDLKITFGSYCKLAGDLIVDRLVNCGEIDRNGFNIIIKNDKYREILDEN